MFGLMGIGYLAGFAAAEIEEKIKARKRQKETAEINKMFRESKNYEEYLEKLFNNK